MSILIFTLYKNQDLKYLPLILTFLILNSCGSIVNAPVIYEENTYSPPDYGNIINWASHPDIDDNADRVPNETFADNQEIADVDVFFVHPTSYASQRKWNLDLDNKRIHRRTDIGTILHQASVFNGSCKIYAPRYRQATLSSYFVKTAKRDEAFEMAYKDVEAAFEYYLEHHNNGRPFILAGHSQGTHHLISLIHNKIDGKLLANRMVTAYLIGMPVYESYFKYMKPCRNEHSTGCYVSWSSMKRGIEDDFFSDAVVTNPLSWTLDTTYASAELNKGVVLWSFKKVEEKKVDAQIHNGMLWVTKPKVSGSSFILIDNYHLFDYNFFWVNIRENVQTRIDAFWKT